MLVDTHVHVDLKADAQIELLLAQMQEHGVAKATLVRDSASVDNSYLIACMRRYPGRFSVVCGVDIKSPGALADLERWRSEGAGSLRLRNSSRSPGTDPLAIWSKAQALGMPVSVNGDTKTFASPEFAHIVERLPNLKFILEHAAGMGLSVIGQFSHSTGEVRPKPSAADFEGALKLAAYPNTYIKIGGMGELCPPPFPYAAIPPYLRMIYDAFGPRRIMWASDWPLVTHREGYGNALSFTRDQLTFCDREDLDWIFGGTAHSIWTFP